MYELIWMINESLLNYAVFPGYVSQIYKLWKMYRPKNVEPI